MQLNTNEVKGMKASDLMLRSASPGFVYVLLLNLFPSFWLLQLSVAMGQATEINSDDENYLTFLHTSLS